MKPPYEITPAILRLVSSISQKTGEVKARFLVRQNPMLRKLNKIRTIHSSLGIEGNTLTEAQITALIENKRVVGPAKDIREVLNAIAVYDKLRRFKSTSEKDFLKAHQLLMSGLVDRPGTYRTTGVGVVKGSKVEHLAPPPELVRVLMTDLFDYLKDESEHALIRSSVFHYELEFIHPFMDGNGRMGRLWQTVILMSEIPLFEFLPFETLIAKEQKKYYQALSSSDKEGKSTKFIQYILEVIDSSLEELLRTSSKRPGQQDRLSMFLEACPTEFTRKDYMKAYPDISTATASRDLANGVQMKLIRKIGDKNTAKYKKDKGK